MSHDTICPFCGCHPFEYVDVGVGSVPVAVTCCGLGNDLFRGQRETPETVTMSRGTFESIANVLSAMRTLGLNPEIDHE